METTLTTNAASVDDAAQAEAALTHLIAQIRQVREQMKADDLEIARIKAENAILKVESQTLREETRAILSNLQKFA